jgi:hypothetical protein
MLFENENTESRPAWRRQRQSKLNELHNNRRQPSFYRPSHDGDVKMPRPVHKPHRAGLQASGVDGGECGPSKVGGNQTADGPAECIMLPSTPPRSLGYRTKPHRFLSHFDFDRRFHPQKGSSGGRGAPTACVSVRADPWFFPVRVIAFFAGRSSGRLPRWRPVHREEASLIRQEFRLFIRPHRQRCFQICASCIESRFCTCSMRRHV